MKYSDLLEAKEMTGFHGSDVKFSKFNTQEVCVAKNINEAKRYGKNLYIVHFKEFLFETKTIYVLDQKQVLKFEPYEEK